MTDDSGEQQELTEISPERQSKTIQQQIIELYNSPNLIHVTVGFWSKAIVEILIIAVPLFVVIVLPGSTLAWLEIGPFTYTRVFVTWVSFSTSIFAITWCLSDPALSEGDEGREDNGDANQD